MSEKKIYKVIHIIDDQNIVINVGANEGIGLGAKFLIYGLGQEMKDPDTGETLEALEIIRGHGAVVHVQNKISTIRCSDFVEEPPVVEKKTYANPLGSLMYFGDRTNEVTKTITPARKTRLDFVDPEVGDIAKLLS